MIQHIQVVFAGVQIADSHDTIRVLETSHPPTYYIPPTDVAMQYLQLTGRRTFCEWKGTAQYFTIVVGEKRAENAAWCYPTPSPAFHSIRDYIAFYPAQLDACFVDGERVKSQPGDFYGGWITSNIVGPFKGGPGTYAW